MVIHKRILEIILITMSADLYTPGTPNVQFRTANFSLKYLWSQPSTWPPSACSPVDVKKRSGYARLIIDSIITNQLMNAEWLLDL